MSGSGPDGEVRVDPETTVLTGLPATTPVRSLLNIASRCNALVTVELRGLSLGADAVSVGLFFIANSPCIISIDLANTGAVLAVEADLAKLFRVARLSLAGNRLKVVEPICAVLAREQCAVTSLDLSANAIDESGQHLILTAIRHSLVLAHLDLSRNGPISRKRAGRICDVLLRNTSMTHFVMPQLTDEHKVSDRVQLMLRQNAFFSEGMSGDKTAASLNLRLLTQLPRQLFSWTQLTSLNLSDNNLTAIPFDILELCNLASLNIANNQINTDSLPVHLCGMGLLKRISVRENPFVWQLPARVAWRDTNALLAYFKEVAMSKDADAAIRRPGRCLVIGESQTGKTKLISTLMQVGADVRGLGSATKLKSSFLRLKRYVEGVTTERGVAKVIEVSPVQQLAPNVSYAFWEMTGKRDFYPAHLFFMHRAECVFVVCFSLVSPNSVMRLDYWMDAITSKCPRADVIVVGTHVDKCTNSDAVIQSIRAKYAALKSIHLHGVFAVNAVSRASVEALRALLISLGDGVFRDSFMSVAPPGYALVGALLGAEDSPVISLSRFHQICDAAFVRTQLQREAVLSSLRQAGVLLWFDQPILRDVLVVDIDWMIQSLSHLVTFDTSLVGPDGKLTERELRQIWPSYVFAERTRPMILNLLEQFGVMHSLSHSYIVPSILSSTEIPLEETARCTALVHRHASKCLTLIRVYRFEAYRPPGFMSQLVTRLLQMINNSSQQVAVWRVGLCCIIEDSNDGTKHCVQTAAEGDSDVIVSLVTPDVTGKTMWLVSHAVDSLLRNWFRNVKYSVFIRSAATGAEVSVEQVSTALQDIRREESVFKLSGTLREYEKIAPDLLLLRTKRVYLEQLTRVRKIGEGSFGVVYLSLMAGQTVVVKEMLDTLMAEDTFGVFQNEVWMLTVLEHPRVIRLLGLTMRPKKTLIMEYMLLGDLRDHLTKGPVLSWPARLCVLIDVCLAMDFAHRLNPPIIHKDLKSPNVFLSITAAGTFIAKVADLGLASWSYRGDRGIGMPDNPTWVAPEVLDRRNNAMAAIDSSVDVYSFGIIMWEVMAGTMIPFSHFTDTHRFMSALADQIVQGMRPQPVSFPGTPSGFVKLMQQCWAQEPTSRGSFRMALAMLCNIRDGLGETFPRVALHDLGVLGSNAQDIAACDGVDNCAIAVDARGMLFRFDLKLGHGASMGHVPVSMRNALICCLPNGTGAVVSSLSEGRSYLQRVGSAQDGPLRLTNINLGKVCALLRAGLSHLVVVGDLGGGEAIMCLINSKSLELVQMVEFQLWGEVVSVACAPPHQRASELWLLTRDAVINRFLIDFQSESLRQLDDLPSPNKRSLQMCFVDSQTVWELLADSLVAVWHDGSPGGGFELPTAIGTPTHMVAAAQGFALIATANFITLWSVQQQQMLASMPTLGTPATSLIFLPSMGGMGISVGARLRSFLVLPEAAASAETRAQCDAAYAELASLSAIEEDKRKSMRVMHAAVTRPKTILRRPAVQSQRISAGAVADHEVTVEELAFDDEATAATAAAAADEAAAAASAQEYDEIFQADSVDVEDETTLEDDLQRTGETLQNILQLLGRESGHSASGSGSGERDSLQFSHGSNFYSSRASTVILPLVIDDADIEEEGASGSPTRSPTRSPREDLSEVDPWDLDVSILQKSSGSSPRDEWAEGRRSPRGGPDEGAGSEIEPRFSSQRVKQGQHSRGSSEQQLSDARAAASGALRRSPRETSSGSGSEVEVRTPGGSLRKSPRDNSSGTSSEVDTRTPGGTLRKSPVVVSSTSPTASSAAAAASPARLGQVWKSPRSGSIGDVQDNGTTVTVSAVRPGLPWKSPRSGSVGDAQDVTKLTQSAGVGDAVAVAPRLAELEDERSKALRRVNSSGRALTGVAISSARRSPRDSDGDLHPPQSYGSVSEPDMLRRRMGRASDADQRASPMLGGGGESVDTRAGRSVSVARTDTDSPVLPTLGGHRSPRPSDADLRLPPQFVLRPAVPQSSMLTRSANDAVLDGGSHSADDDDDDDDDDVMILRPPKDGDEPALRASAPAVARPAVVASVAEPPPALPPSRPGVAAAANVAPASRLNMHNTWSRSNTFSGPSSSAAHELASSGRRESDSSLSTLAADVTAALAARDAPPPLPKKPTAIASASVRARLPAWKQLPAKPSDSEHYMQGNLRMRKRIGYKVRFFEVIDANKVLYYDSAARAEIKGQVRIPEIRTIEVSAADSERAAFWLCTDDETLELLAADHAEMEQWVDGLVSLNPAIELVQERRVQALSPRLRPTNKITGPRPSSMGGKAVPAGPRNPAHSRDAPGSPQTGSAPKLRLATTKK